MGRRADGRRARTPSVGSQAYKAIARRASLAAGRSFHSFSTVRSLPATRVGLIERLLLVQGASFRNMM